MFLSEDETRSICGAVNLDIINCRKKDYSRFFFLAALMRLGTDFLFSADVSQRTIMKYMTQAEISI